MVLAGGIPAQNIDIIGPPGSGFFGSQVLPLPNGNYVVMSPAWDNGGVTDVGAVTWVDSAWPRDVFIDGNIADLNFSAR